MSTQPAGDASEVIVVDTIRDGLRAAASGTTYDLTDPEDGNRGDDAPFAVTSRPDRDPHYPHVVALEAGMSGGRLDSRVDLHENQYDVRIEVFARSDTEMYNLRDDVRQWFQANHDTFRDAGWTDVGIASNSPMNWEGDVQLSSWQITYTGTLYTTT